MKSISEGLLSRIEMIISRYSLFQDKDVFVAYSGGKDSLFLCLALQALGYYVHPIIIDIGYNVDWTLALENVKTHRMDALVLNREYIYNHYPEIIYAVDHLFETVVKISGEIQQSATICTPCYNAKMTILRKWAEENGVSKIAIGHHGTDAISSMLKSFFYYIDRWDNDNERFDYSNFYELILSQRTVFSLSVEEFVVSNVGKRINDLIRKGFVGTDEPVAQILTDSTVMLCRPLYSLFENDIIGFYNNALLHNKAFNIKVSQTECYLTGYRREGFMTPRELIQFKLLPLANEELLCHLLSKCSESMDEHGFLRYNVRNNRNDILGGNYKVSMDLAKKI